MTSISARPNAFRGWISRPGVLAVGGAALLAIAIALPATGLLFDARWDVPLVYSGDGIATADHIRTILETGWFDNQPALGAPYGQHYLDYPTTDQANFVAAWLIGLLVHSWGAVMNIHFLIGFPLAAGTMVWFLRRVGVRSIIAGALGVVYAHAPYHFYRSEAHLFLSWY